MWYQVQYTSLCSHNVKRPILTPVQNDRQDIGLCISSVVFWDIELKDKDVGLHVSIHCLCPVRPYFLHEFVTVLSS